MNYLDTEISQPSDLEIQIEACRIIHAADLVSASANPRNDYFVRDSANASWLRDIVTASPEAIVCSMNGAIGSQAKDRLTKLRINGKVDLFEDCWFERQLRAVYLQSVGSQSEFYIQDKVLQDNAAHIVRQAEEQSTTPSDIVAKWFQRMIFGSTDWLTGIRNRIAEGQLTTQVLSRRQTPDYAMRVKPPANTQEASSGLAEDDTAAPLALVPSFKFTESGEIGNLGGLGLPADGTLFPAPDAESVVPTIYPVREDMPSLPHLHNTSGYTLADTDNATGHLATAVATSTRPPYFPNDANTYQPLARVLARFVAAAMSDKNPNRHVPTDQEIQYQARWFEFNE